MEGEAVRRRPPVRRTRSLLPLRRGGQFRLQDVETSLTSCRRFFEHPHGLGWRKVDVQRRVAEESVEYARAAKKYPRVA